MRQETVNHVSYICMYVCMYMYTISICICICISMYVYTYTYIYMYMYVCMYACMHVCICTHKYMYIYIFTYIYIYVNACILIKCTKFMCRKQKYRLINRNLVPLNKWLNPPSKHGEISCLKLGCTTPKSVHVFFFI